MSWLSLHSAALTTLAALIQASAVVAGIGFAVWEFVLSDRQQRMQRVQHTLGFVDRRNDEIVTEAADELYHIMLDSVKEDVFYADENVFNRLSRTSRVSSVIENFYQMLFTCTRTMRLGACTGIFCLDATSLNQMVQYLNDQEPVPIVHMDLTHLAFFAETFCAQHDSVDHESKDWGPDPKKWKQLLEEQDGQTQR